MILYGGYNDGLVGGSVLCSIETNTDLDNVTLVKI